MLNTTARIGFATFGDIEVPIHIWQATTCKLWWYGALRKRATSLFLIHWYKIWQSINCDGRAAIRMQRQQYEGKPLQVKLFGLAKFLRLQMQQLLHLQSEVRFKIRTHLKRSFEKAQQQPEITIYSIKKKATGREYCTSWPEGLSEGAFLTQCQAAV